MSRPRVDKRALALRQAWITGDLSYKLRPYQRELYDFFWKSIRDPGCKTAVTEIARRSGKSFVATLVSLEYSLRVPQAQIWFVAPSRQSLRNITAPTMAQLLVDCPPELKPVHNSQTHSYVFPSTGSTIRLGGANAGAANDMRGTSAHLAVVDEVGFVDDPTDLVSSVLMPMTLTTAGTLLLATTPPASPAHPFIEMALEARARGHHFMRDVYWCGYPPEELKIIADSVGGTESAAWRREFLCERVVDSKLAIVPEWRKEFVEARPDEDPLAKYRHRYVALDPGFSDLTAVLFGTYEFEKARLTIDGELMLPGHDFTTPTLADGIRKKEEQLGYTKSGGCYRRVADNNNLNLLADLSRVHGLAFSPTTKEDLPAMVNAMRMFVAAGRLRVHPDCRTLLATLEGGVWKSPAHIGRDFARLGDSLGHCDAIAALMYLIRNLDTWTNPIPANLGFDFQTMQPARVPQDEPVAGAAQILTSIFARPRFKR